MLVLSRFVGEGVWIGENVRVIIAEIRGGKVRLGIEAPPEVEIHRDEVRERINQKKREGGDSCSKDFY